jgi:hypothetical protein
MRVIWIITSNVQRYRLRCMKPWRWMKEIKHWVLMRQRSLLLQNLLTASKDPHNSLSGCCCSLLCPINVLKGPDATFYQSHPHSQLQNRHGPPLTLKFRSRFLSFLTGALLPTFNKMFDSELLIMGVQQLQDIFSIVRTNLQYSLRWCVWGPMI